MRPLPLEVRQAARRVRALLQAAEAQGLVTRWRFTGFSGNPLPGLAAVAFHARSAPQEEVERLEEALLDIEDELGVGIAVLLVPEP